MDDEEEHEEEFEDEEAFEEDEEHENEEEEFRDEDGENIEDEEEEETEKKVLFQKPYEEFELTVKKIQNKRNKDLDFENVNNLTNALTKVKLAWAEDMPWFNKAEYKLDPARKNYPESYYLNSGKERAVLLHAENFRRQFIDKFPDRRPLFIAPKNECGIQKLFPTYIKPRLLGHYEFFYADKCVEYFKDFFNNDFCEPPTDFPAHVRSHLDVFKDRKANCYEHAIIIATALLGSGYNCYVVDGYATEEITTLCSKEDFKEDTDEPFDFFKDEIIVEKPKRAVFDVGELETEYDLAESERVQPVSPLKYKTIARKHFISNYEEKMKNREKEKQLEEEEKARAEEQRLFLAANPPPPPDKLIGYRVHAWVLVLPGSRDVTTPFFLEPFTGTQREIYDEGFTGIETIFNHKNFYVNLQDCKKGVGALSYDFEDVSCWAKLLIEPPVKKEMNGEGDGTKSSLDDEENEDLPIPEMYLDMPVSWTKDMRMSIQEYRLKYPNGRKTFEYNDAIVERATPYACEDGMVLKVLKFNGSSRKSSDLVYIDERFDKRVDRLIRRKWEKKGRIVHEYFDKGRPDCLKEHVHVSGKNKAHSWRHLFYWPSWHPERVSHREVVDNGHGLIEHFEGRDDFLNYRYTMLGGVLCLTMRSEKQNKTTEFLENAKGGSSAKSRPKMIINGIIEKYDRNPSKTADEDICEKHLLFKEGKFRILFHFGPECYTRSFIEFLPSRSFKKNDLGPALRVENTHEFHVDPFTEPFSNYKKSQILKKLNEDEVNSSAQARRAEDEIYLTVTSRVQEDWFHELEPQEYEPNTDKKEESLIARSANEDDDETESVFTTLQEIDFASPYLVCGEPKSKAEEIELKKRIMQDAKDRITRKAEYIRACYNAESRQLKHIIKSGCSDLEQKVAEEEGYESCFDRSLSRLHIMEEKLIRLQAKAPRDYCDLLIKVLQHPELNRYATQEKIERELEIKRQIQLRLMEEAMRLRAEQKLSCCQLDYYFKYLKTEKDDGGEKVAEAENQAQIQIQ